MPIPEDIVFNPEMNKLPLGGKGVIEKRSRPALLPESRPLYPYKG